ncbi:exosortase family protein XrtF [Croceiramulus getboli]|nr:exosortase family protein XrtF [Flavobacteriaceae bacterium YJPT1-3]
MGSYLVLTVLYRAYLHFFRSDLYPPDPVTYVVAQSSEALLQFFGYTARVIPSTTVAAMDLYLEGKYLAIIIEGCNALSIIVLFSAFVLAFWNGWKSTLVFIGLGALAIFVVNIGRIALLSVALYRYPDHTEFLHGTLFPAIIYGFVFLLWVYWVRRFTKNESP